MSSPSHTVVLSALSGLVVAQDCPVLFFEGLEFAYQRVHRRIHSVTEEIHRPSVVYSHATVYELAGFPTFSSEDDLAVVFLPSPRSCFLLFLRTQSHGHVLRLLLF